jgi:hypothetical protein
VALSYFLIAGGTFFAGLFAGRIGIHSEYLGYIILALGGFLGGILAARASKGSTVIEPAIGAVLLLGSFVAIGVVTSGSEAGSLLLPATMKAIALTAGASAGGGIVGALVTEKLFGDADASGFGWILIVALATFGAGVMGSTFGGVIGGNSAGPLFGLLATCCLVVGIATGASATARPLGAAFLGGIVGLGGFFFLAVYVIVSIFGGSGSGEAKIPSEAYAGIAIVAGGGGLVTMIGALIGWSAAGKKN